MQIASSSRVAARVHVRGIVQGVGFRPHVYRLAETCRLDGWVLNGDDGVRIHVEGAPDSIAAFLEQLRADPPPAAQIASLEIVSCDPEQRAPGFEILHSASGGQPTTRISPDLPVCDDCLRELFDARDSRCRYPYINCTNCGPRFSIVRSLPYDRGRTTMADWPLCPRCASQYDDPGDRRFHAQPVACGVCGPAYRLVVPGAEPLAGDDSIDHAARLLREGRILAVKGIGGYHLACDADNECAVAAMRDRKYRKEQAFAVMVRDIGVADETVDLLPAARTLISSRARPIVLAPWRTALPGVAPGNRDLGVMLPYTPLHHLLFAAGAPQRLVMTSGNRSSEPIAFRDEDALARLGGLADAFLVGERPIARRVDDSVVRIGPLGPIVLRRSRGLAPAIVAMLPASRPILAVGGDLKSAITIVVDGQAYGSQHIGDLSHLDSRTAFDETIRDVLAMYAVPPDELIVAHDCHPDYLSTAYASGVRCASCVPIQHHRAHVASVLAERGLLDHRVVGVAFDGTGYGDDGTIWGGEFFAGSVAEGFARVAHLRSAVLPGGDAAALYPVQAAAGFLAEIEDDLPDLASPPFSFPKRYTASAALVRSGLRVFATTSAGRLFDTVAALLGFTRPVTFEGQAAMWLEHLARGADEQVTLPCHFTGTEVDWRETLIAIIDARLNGRSMAAIAAAFHQALGRAIGAAAATCAERANVDTVVVSGGVMQNQLLIQAVHDALAATGLQLWTNREVPSNDGGLSLGQAALALFAQPLSAFHTTSARC